MEYKSENKILKFEKLIEKTTYTKNNKKNFKGHEERLFNGYCRFWL